MRRSIRASRLLSLAIIAAPAGNAFPAVFTNSAPIVFPGPGSSSGTQISVSGFANIISSLTVSISNFSDTHSDHVGLVLVAPSGAALVLMGDAGGNAPTPVNIAFTDGTTRLPQTALTFSGTFSPAQYASIGSFPSPGPGLAYSSPAVFGTSTLTSTFASTNPNGNWSLYAMDPFSGDTGGIANGWTLQITATPEPASLTALAGAAALLRRRRRAG